MEAVLSHRRVNMVEHVRVSEVRASMKAICEARINRKESGSSDMVKLDMKQWLRNLMLDVVMMIISGNRFPLNDEAPVRIQNAVNKFFELSGTFVVSDFIPYMNSLDLGGYDKKKMKMAGEEIDNILEGWLKERKSDTKSGQQHEGNKFFIDVLISIFQGASEEDFPEFDHNTILKDKFLTFLVGTLETTYVTLMWALSLLLNNPKALVTAQCEIDEHDGTERLVEESDMKNLIYLDTIIKETLRLHLDGPLSVPRETIEDCIVSGYNIPKGTRLVVNLWKIHRDPKIWSDPHEFLPERFLTSQKDIDVKGKYFEYLPFGSGRRICPGVFFSRQIMRLTLASLIQQFVLKRPSNEHVDMSESP